MPRVLVSTFAAAAALFIHFGRRKPCRRPLHHRGIDNLHRKLRIVRSDPAGLRGRERYSSACGRAWHRASHTPRPKTVMPMCSSFTTAPRREAFVADGYGVARHDVMYNDFVIVGPKSDPAGVEGLENASEALGRIAAATAFFVSRGDDSGTHKKELALWKDAGLDPTPQSGTWYRELGAGMGATLNAAAAMEAYSLIDRGTWLSFENKADLAVLLEGNERLFNPYGVILVDPARFPMLRPRMGKSSSIGCYPTRDKRRSQITGSMGSRCSFPTQSPANLLVSPGYHPLVLGRAHLQLHADHLIDVEPGDPRHFIERQRCLFQEDRRVPIGVHATAAVPSLSGV